MDKTSRQLQTDKKKGEITFKALIILILTFYWASFAGPDRVTLALGADLSLKNTQSTASTYSSMTVLLMDTSGSMSEMDASGRSKIEAAIEAAGNVVEIIQAENELLPSHLSLLGIVDFNDYATVDLEVSENISSARSILNGLIPNGGTGMPDGLKAALNLLKEAPPSAKPIIILLSDGMANVGLGGDQNKSPEEVRQQVFDLADEAAQEGVCIYTIGLGTLGSAGDISGQASIDVDLLQRLPQIAGCGEFYLAQDASALSNIYLKLHHTSLGNVLFEKEGSIHQDEEIVGDPVQVPSNQEMLLYTVNWKGSKINIKLQDPAGNIIDETQTNVKTVTTPKMTGLLVQNPMAGVWKPYLYGFDIPEGSTVYYSIISVRPIPIPPTMMPTLTVLPSGGTTYEGGEVLLLFFALLFAILGWLFFRSGSNRYFERAGFENSSACLVGLNGLFHGQTIPLYSNILIGRGSDCTIHLPYRNVSRHHCQIFTTRGVWILRDLGSGLGTFVNGSRVNQIVLHPGDVIYIGAETFMFEG
jgi:hypothetical protein